MSNDFIYLESILDSVLLKTLDKLIQRNQLAKVQHTGKIRSPGSAFHTVVTCPKRTICQ